jgi:hypothetical protein
MPRKTCTLIFKSFKLLPCRHDALHHLLPGSPKLLEEGGDVKRTPSRCSSTAVTRLIDRGFHPPTVYFPLIVEEALMVEPTETASLETLDSFAEAMLEIAAQAERDPHPLRQAPVTAPVGRLDEARAARNLIVRWHPPSDPAQSTSDPADEGPPRSRPPRSRPAPRSRSASAGRGR